MAGLGSRLFSATSQWFNVLLLNGHPNESISGRAYRQNWTAAVKVINGIFFWQSHHCRGAYAKDVEWAKQFASEHIEAK
jgi:hypothetical protein